MRGARYHGGFDHPVRSFVIGVTLLVLLFGGFVIGVEAGTHPLEQAAATKLVEQGTVHTVTVQAPVVRTVVNGHVRVVRLRSTTTRVVLITRNGKTVIAYEPIPAGSTATSGPQSAAAPTVYTLPTSTVTETQPPETVTEPPVTVTVTEPGSTDTSGSSNASTSSP
jgi:hypothetical protein